MKMMSNGCWDTCESCWKFAIIITALRILKIHLINCNYSKNASKFTFFNLVILSFNLFFFFTLQLNNLTLCSRFAAAQTFFNELLIRLGAAWHFFSFYQTNLMLLEKKKSNAKKLNQISNEISKLLGWRVGSCGGMNKSRAAEGKLLKIFARKVAQKVYKKKTYNKNNWKPL